MDEANHYGRYFSYSAGPSNGTASDGGHSGPPKKRHKIIAASVDSAVKIDLSMALGMSNVASCSKPSQDNTCLDMTEEEGAVKELNGDGSDYGATVTTPTRSRSVGSDATESFRDPSRNKRKPAKMPVSVFVPSSAPTSPPAPRDGSRNRRKGKAERSSVDTTCNPKVGTSSGRVSARVAGRGGAWASTSPASQKKIPPMDYGDANSQMGSSAEDDNYIDDIVDYAAPVAARTRAAAAAAGETAEIFVMATSGEVHFGNTE